MSGISSSGFEFFFQVKFGKLVCDGRSRSFDEIFDCAKNEWNSISSEIRESYGNFDSDCNESVKIKCKKTFETFLKRLRGFNPGGHQGECSICEETSANLDQHLLRKHPQELYECQMCVNCEEKLRSPEELYTHLRMKQCDTHVKKTTKPSRKSKKIVAQISKTAKQKSCHDCQLQFESLAKLKYHRLKTHGKWQGSLTCDICSKVYGTLSNLRKHQKIVHEFNGSSLKSCEFCDYQTHDLHNLKTHQRRHSDSKPFTCKKCTYGFVKKSDLTRHEKICKGIKHKCSKCQEIFHFRQHFEEHLSWSEDCGAIREKVGTEVPKKSPMIRLNTKDSFIVSLNCDQLMDEKVFQKKKKRARCGLCKGCERTRPCGKCNPCLRKAKRTLCDLRRCSDLAIQFDVKKGQEANAHRIFNAVQGAPDDSFDELIPFSDDEEIKVVD